MEIRKLSCNSFPKSMLYKDIPLNIKFDHSCSKNKPVCPVSLWKVEDPSAVHVSACSCTDLKSICFIFWGMVRKMHKSICFIFWGIVRKMHNVLGLWEPPMGLSSVVDYCSGVTCSWWITAMSSLLLERIFLHIFPRQNPAESSRIQYDFLHIVVSFLSLS